MAKRRATGAESASPSPVCLSNLLAAFDKGILRRKVNALRTVSAGR
jgi:hypothetical protein